MTCEVASDNSLELLDRTPCDDIVACNNKASETRLNDCDSVVLLCQPLNLRPADLSSNTECYVSSDNRLYLDSAGPTMPNIAFCRRLNDSNTLSYQTEGFVNSNPVGGATIVSEKKRMISDS